MTDILSTAYPRLTTHPSPKHLEEIYTPTDDEIDFVSLQGSSPAARLTKMVLLKTYQTLARFPNLDEVPIRIIKHICHAMNLPPDTPIADARSSRQRQRKAIRAFMNTRPFSQGGRDLADTTIRRAAQIMGHPKGLINATIETLIAHRFELPAFSTLNRLVRHIRFEINNTWYERIYSRLAPDLIQTLDHLPLLSDQRTRTDFALIKEVPKKPGLSEFKNLQRRLKWLESLADTDSALADVPPRRIDLFAEEAKTIETGDWDAYNPPHRYTLLLCLLHQAKVKTRDNIVDTFRKRMKAVHRHAKDQLDGIQAEQRKLSEHFIEMLMGIARAAQHASDPETLGMMVMETFEEEGGATYIYTTCQTLATYHDENTLPLLWGHYASHSRTVFDVMYDLDMHATSPDDNVLIALETLHYHRQDDELPDDTPLDFASDRWQQSIRQRDDQGNIRIDRRQFEVCVFTYLAKELNSGDIAVDGADAYSDYRHQLMTWDDCLEFLEPYCNEMGFPADGDSFVEQLKEAFIAARRHADSVFLDAGQLTFDEHGRPSLVKIKAKTRPKGAVKLRNAIKKRMPARTILDALAFVNNWVSFTHHFGPFSGTAPKIADRLARYLMTCFGYGSNLGPTQTAKHSGGRMTYKHIARINAQHITNKKLEDAIKDIINFYLQFDLPLFWGAGQTAAADGTVFNTYLNNIMAERHIRYGEYGGVSYHHISDNYLAVFSHFISVGSWEGNYIADGLMENTSDLTPDTLHADTHGQSLTVFGLTHLLGINLMPRIRNWKDLDMFRPDPSETYLHIDTLFTKTIDWELIRRHWRELMQVVLSIRAGKLMPSTILRKLGNNSKKNRLYKAFRELGRVIRTMFLLRFISEPDLRRQITAVTNKIESYHAFIAWIFFGGHGIINTNDPVEMEKRTKYNDLVANAMILLTVADMTKVILELNPDEFVISRDTLEVLSPYMTDHYLRFGNFEINFDNLPDEPIYSLPPEMRQSKTQQTSTL